MRSLIVIMTDFGTKDAYVGVMKGVIKQINPDAEIIDLTHDIPRQSIEAGHIVLSNSYPYFPDHTIFLVVVDPGVGSTRQPVIMKAGSYRFIAPNNGVLTGIIEHYPGEYELYELENPDYRLATVSHTFHGRDIFAPAAAYASLGKALTSFGKPVQHPVMLAVNTLKLSNHSIVGCVTYIDHFGNALTNLGKFIWVDDDLLQIVSAGQTITFEAAKVTIKCNEHVLHGIYHAFHEAEKDHALAYIESSGYLEIAVNQGNAATQLSLTTLIDIEIILH